MPDELCLTPNQLADLEKLFAATLPADMGGCPLGLGIVQLPKRRAASLVKKGLAEHVERRYVPRDGFPAMTIPGYAITMRGHIAYCLWADENCPDEEL